MQSQEIQTRVQRVMFPPEGSGWSIIRTNAGIAKGEIDWRPKEGEEIKMTGKFDVYKGERQFKFSRVEPVIPEDSEAECKYACELTKGLGESMAVKIFEYAGNNWREIESGAVPGLTEAKHKLLLETINMLECQKERTKAITFLISKGCTTKLAQKCWERHGRSTVPKITENCYHLADLPRCGFKQIDTTVRHAFAIQDTDPMRIKAGIMYALNELLKGSGSSYSLFPILQAECVKLLNVTNQSIIDIGRKMIQDKELAAYPEHKAVTLPELQNWETTIWEYVS